MPINDISLLPDELRGRETEAKAKAREAKAPPSFSMHVPENELSKATTQAAAQPRSQPGVKFGNGEKPEEKKGLFKILKKIDKPAAPVVPTAPVAPPKPKLKPDMWLKYFDPGRGLFKKIKPTYLNSRTTTAEYNWVIQSEYWLKIRAILLVVLIVLIVFSVGWVSMKSYHNGKSAQYNELVNNVNRLNGELQNREGYRDRAMALINQATIVHRVMAERVSWTKLFNFLETKTLAEVSYIDFQIINDSLVNLTVVAPSYSTLARQVEIFEQAEGISLADISDANVEIDKHTDEQTVTGIVQLKLAPEFWSK